MLIRVFFRVYFVPVFLFTLLLQVSLFYCVFVLSRLRRTRPGYHYKDQKSSTSPSFWKLTLKTVPSAKCLLSSVPQKCFLPMVWMFLPAHTLFSHQRDDTCCVSSGRSPQKCVVAAAFVPQPVIESFFVDDFSFPFVCVCLSRLGFYCFCSFVRFCFPI